MFNTVNTSSYTTTTTTSSHEQQGYSIYEEGARNSRVQYYMKLDSRMITRETGGIKERIIYIHADQTNLYTF